MRGFGGLVPFELVGDAVDGDVAFLLWYMGVLPASDVRDGSQQIVRGLNTLSMQRGYGAVTQRGNAVQIDERLQRELGHVMSRLEALPQDQAAALRARLVREQQSIAAAPPVARPRASAATTSSATNWVPIVVIGGALVIAVGAYFALRD